MLTPEIVLEQFLIFQESEYLEGFLAPRNRTDEHEDCRAANLFQYKKVYHKYRLQDFPVPSTHKKKYYQIRYIGLCVTRQRIQFRYGALQRVHVLESVEEKRHFREHLLF